MKKIMFMSLFTFMIVFSSSAYSAEEGWYVRGSVGPALLEDADGSTISGVNLAAIEDLINADLPDGTTYSLDLEYDPSFFIKLAPGYNFGYFRLEGELTYQINKINKVNEHIYIPDVSSDSGSSELNGSDVTATSILINGYYDFLKGNTLQPYITAGIGMARVKTHIQVVKDSDSVFAYQAGVGLSYNMSENVVLDFGYRYFATSDIEFLGVKLSNSSHSLLFGARYNF